MDANYTGANAAAGQTMYYGFNTTYQGRQYASPTGSFRAINNANTMSQLNYAVVSCSNYGFGLYNVYDLMANLDSLDFWSHVGDVIYEYADLAYPSATAKLRNTVTDPPNEMVSLDDYRRRHRESRSDRSMQLLSSKVPLILVADDHDYVNNAWMTGAENHQPNGNAGAGFDGTLYPEGDYYNRINAAMQAWYEYQPIRDPSAALLSQTTAFNAALGTYLNTSVPAAAAAAGYTSVQSISGAPVTNLTALTRARIANQQRTFNFGGLITYVLAEDRLGYRTSAEATLTNGGYEELGGFDCPACPTNAPACLAAQAQQFGAAYANYSKGVAASFPLACSPQLLGLLASSMITTPYANWTAAQTAQLSAYAQALEALQAYNGNITEHIIGTGPAMYIGAQFAASKAAGVPFQVWGSQTVFAPQPFPDLISSSTKGRATSQQAAAAGALAYLCGTALPTVCAGALGGYTFESDDWDGFNAERNFILQMLAQGNTPIINSGDSHSFWLSTVPNSTFTSRPLGPLAVEFGGGSVTSPGWGDSFAGLGPSPGYTLGLSSQAFLNFIEDGHVLAAQNAAAQSLGFGLQTVRHAHGVLVFKVRRKKCPRGSKPALIKRCAMTGERQLVRGPDLHGGHNEQHQLHRDVRLCIWRPGGQQGRVDEPGGGGRWHEQRVHLQPGLR